MPPLRRPIRHALALGGCLVALTLVGCGDDDGTTDAAPIDSSTVAPETIEGSSTSAATSTSTSTSTPGTSTSTPTTSPTSTSTPPTTSPSTSASTELPEARQDLEHGGATWAVVLAASADVDDPAVVAAEEAAGAVGYQAGPTDCDEGAAAALGHDGTSEDLYTVSVYFDTQEDAQLAAQAFHAAGHADATVAEVRTFCLD